LHHIGAGLFNIMTEELTYKYYDPKTLLVINGRGKLKIIYTPFRAQCVQLVDSIPINAWVYVEEVHSNQHDELFFLVFGRQYLHRHFRIPVQF
jgi:hypothetical protein